MKILVFPVRPDFWRRPAVAAAASEVLAAARRLTKSVDTARERRRLGASLRAIEEATRSACPEPRILEGEDADTMVAALPIIGTTRLPFRILDHTGGSGGFVLMPILYDPASSVTPLRDPAPPRAGAPAGTADMVESTRTGHDRDRLIREIKAARVDGRLIVLGRAKHKEIMTAMRASLHGDGPRDRFEVRFVYSDGSMSGAVRLGAVPVRAMPTCDVSLAIGLNSCRHFSLDTEIDLYLLRTSEFERRDRDTFADQEDFSYARMARLLADYREQSLDLTLFHTGLEPAVIGAYRAIIEALIAGQTLQVTPFVHPDSPPGEKWW